MYAGITPHGGTLRERISISPPELSLEEIHHLFSLQLSKRQLCDLELILNGGFSPLKGFMTEADYNSVLNDMRLSDGTLWPLPITLDVEKAFATRLHPGEYIALKDPENIVLAVLKVESSWEPDLKKEAKATLGSIKPEHPGVHYLLHETKPIYLGGEIYGLNKLQLHYDFKTLRHTPRELRKHFKTHELERVVAFQTRNPMHRAHQAITQMAADQADATLLLHPVVGMSKTTDIHYYRRVHCYQKMLKHYPQEPLLSLLPLAMRMAGPKEALLHAIIRQNYGATHFIIGRDHASPGKDNDGNLFYPLDASEKLVKQFESELEITPIYFPEVAYVEERDEYCLTGDVRPGETALRLSGTELKEKLEAGEAIPKWFTYPDIAEELAKAVLPKNQQGFTVFFTGLPSAGKSTIANIVRIKLLDLTDRQVTVLDGDAVRHVLSEELGFTKAHRIANILRVGYVANEITRHGGIALCALIAPYHTAREQVRHRVRANGGFIEVYVSTPVEVCKQRDLKGIYAKAKAGKISHVTGIDDPFEVPTHPDLAIDASLQPPENIADQIIALLNAQGYL